MKYDEWKEPGKTGKAYYIFWGLKSVKQVAEAVGIIAREKKIGADKLEFSTAWIKGEDLYIGKGPVVGAKKAVAIFRKGSK